MPTKGRVQNKVALVTGGADGIGKAIAKLLIKEGATVIVADVNAELGEKTATEIGGVFMSLDVSGEEAWQKVMAKIKADFGKLNILVNNAGIMGKGAQDPEHSTLAEWHLLHKVNLDSVFLGCKYAIQLMKEHKDEQCSIVNMSSRSGVVGVPTAVGYASTKAAIRNHTKSVALYCAQQGYNIRCNSVHPASIMTGMWKQMLGEGEAFEANHKKLSEGIPMGRFGTPEEVAYGVLFLASDESSYTTGSELTIDGGILAGTSSSPDTGLKK